MFVIDPKVEENKEHPNKFKSYYDDNDDSDVYKNCVYTGETSGESTSWGDQVSGQTRIEVGNGYKCDCVRIPRNSKFDQEKVL